MKNDTYQTLRDAVIYGDGTDVFLARETAYSWHGGQFSALYSFASCDCEVQSESHREDLQVEVAQCLMSLDARAVGDSTEDDYAELKNLEACINLLPSKELFPCD